MIMYDNDFERKTKINRNKKITATYIKIYIYFIGNLCDQFLHYN